MNQPQALYYPHARIADENLIKNALLLWDQVEYMVPMKNWHHEEFPSKVYNEAIDLIAVPHVPTSDVKARVHKRVSTLIKEGLPPWFYLSVTRNVRDPQLYDIYLQKFGEETWQLLREYMLAEFNQEQDGYSLTPYLGLMMMALLADECAGKFKRKITDRAEAYAWLQKYATIEAGGEYILGPDAEDISPTVDRLVTLSISVLNTDDLPISTLVEMRKREARQSTSDYRNFRIKYLNKVDECVDRISKEARTSEDVQEIERQFQLELKSDLDQLGKELSFAGNRLIFSKEMGVAAAAVKGAFSMSITGLADLPIILGGIGVGALVRVGKEYQANRRKAMTSNSMSWLYLTHREKERFRFNKVIF